MAQQKHIKELEIKIAELEKEKKQLLKLVSHDVKSPFNKLFALSNLLQLVSENLNEEQLDYLNRMEWVIKEGLTVVRNLLDLRAIENNSIELNLEELQIDAILDGIFKNYQKQITIKKLSIKSKIDKVTAWSDKIALERVIDNLVSNTVKFSPKEAEIKVHLLAQTNSVELTISSMSGPIPKEEVSNLFKRNSPLSTRPTHGESALGNGLFIAQSYAAALKSALYFNQKKSDVTFTFEMPLKKGVN